MNRQGTPPLPARSPDHRSGGMIGVNGESRPGPVLKFDPFAIASSSLMRLITSNAGLEIRDRFYHLRRYQACFLGNELVDLLVKQYDLNRRQAVRVGQRLLAQDLIHHVAGEHEFKDAPLFYAVGLNKPAPAQTDLDLSLDALAGMVRTMRGPDGIPVGCNRRLLVNYPECFVAGLAVDWICERAQLSRRDAVQAGQAMLQSNFIRHVFDEMDFQDGRHLYRFV